MSNYAFYKRNTYRTPWVCKTDAALAFTVL